MTVEVELVAAVIGGVVSLVLGVGAFINNSKNRKVGVAKDEVNRVEMQVQRSYTALEKHIEVLEKETKKHRERIAELEVRNKELWDKLVGCYESRFKE